MLRRHALAALLATSFAGGSLQAAQAPQAFPFQVERACTNSESWSIPPEFKARFGDLFGSAPSGDGDSIERYLTAVDRWRGMGKANTRLAAEYWIWRTLFQLNVTVLARAGFRTLLTEAAPPAMNGVKLAAIECINRISERYRVLGFSDRESRMIEDFPLAGLNDEQKHVLWAARTRIAIDRTSASEDSDLSDVAPSLRGAGPYEQFVKALVSLRVGTAAESIPLLQAFLAEPSKLPDDLKPRIEFARLTLGRLYYETGKYDRAIQELGAIQQGTPFFIQALSNLAWANLMKKDHGKAVGVAYNLQVTGLARAFVPDAPIIAAVAFFEVCNYAGALQNTHFFEKKYGSSYRWLKALNTRSETKNLYPSLVKYIKTGRGIPKLVAADWVNSNIFVSSQAQLNLILDERDRVKAMREALLKQAKKQEPGARAALAYWDKLSGFYAKDLDKLETQLVERINHDFELQAKTMLSQLDDFAENAQLLEVEIFSVASRNSISHGAEGGKNDTESEHARAAARGNEPKSDWVWGRKVASEVAESDEIWEDELGLFKADVTDQCRHKKN